MFAPAGGGIAVIGRTRKTVIAVYLNACATAAPADVSSGTFKLIVAGSCIIMVYTRAIAIADIIRAKLAIRCTRHAIKLVGVYAAYRRIARVLCTDLIVVADLGKTAATLSGAIALLVCGAGVSVITFLVGLCSVEAFAISIANIQRTGIAVIRAHCVVSLI